MLTKRKTYEILLGLSMLVIWNKYKGWAGAALAIFYVLIFPGNINQYVEHINAFGLDTDQARLIRLFFQRPTCHTNKPGKKINLADSGDVGIFGSAFSDFS